MEPVLFSLLLAWGLVRYGVTDLVAAVNGTESPRYRERRQRLAQQHERHMARLRTGPTIGQAVAHRIAHRIARPSPPKERTGQHPFRRFLGEWWEDSWNHATERRLRHHDRKLSGDLPRQRAAHATKDAFARWREQWRHRHATDWPTAGSATGATWSVRHDRRDAGDAPPESDTERTGPIHVVAERLALPVAPDESDPESARSTPTHEERNPATMTDYHANTPAAPSGEVTNITTALDYARGMTEQFRAAVTHTEGLAAQTGQMSEWAQQASASAEASIAGITAGEVTGEAVENLHAAQEQMAAAAAQVAEAAGELHAAQEQFAATANAFDATRHVFERQQAVAEAYAANPDAGSKQFNTYA